MACNSSGIKDGGAVEYGRQLQQVEHAVAWNMAYGCADWRDGGMG